MRGAPGSIEPGPHAQPYTLTHDQVCASPGGHPDTDTAPNAKFGPSPHTNRRSDGRRSEAAVFASAEYGTGRIWKEGLGVAARSAQIALLLTVVAGAFLSAFSRRMAAAPSLPWSFRNSTCAQFNAIAALASDPEWSTAPDAVLWRAMIGTTIAFTLIAAAVLDARTLYIDRDDTSLRWWMRPRPFSLKADLWTTFCTRTTVARIFFVYPGHTVYTRAQLTHVLATSLSISLLMVCIFEEAAQEACENVEAPRVTFWVTGLATVCGTMLTTSGRLAFKAADLYDGPARAIYRANKEVRYLALMGQSSNIGAQPSIDAPPKPVWLGRRLSGMPAPTTASAPDRPGSPPPSPPNACDKEHGHVQVRAAGEVYDKPACTGVKSAAKLFEAKAAGGERSKSSLQGWALRWPRRLKWQRRQTSDVVRRVKHLVDVEGRESDGNTLLAKQNGSLVSRLMHKRRGRKRLYGFRTRTLVLEPAQLVARVELPVIAYGFEVPAAKSENAEITFVPALRIGWALPQFGHGDPRRFTVRYAISSLPQGCPLGQVQAMVLNRRDRDAHTPVPPFALWFSPWLLVAWVYNAFLLWGSYFWLLNVYYTRVQMDAIGTSHGSSAVNNAAYAHGVAAGFAWSASYSVVLVDACKVFCLCLTSYPALKSFGISKHVEGEQSRGQDRQHMRKIRAQKLIRRVLRRFHKLLDLLG